MMTEAIQKLAVLYYFHDPMCSWCWGFRPVWEEVQRALGATVKIRYVTGGLAADTDQVMPASMQKALQQTWKRIQQEIPGTAFNFDFWTLCTPRRSTFAACRAVIAGKMQHPDFESSMLLAIQRAYYLEARNPSDDNVLIQLAADSGLDVERFIRDFYSDDCRNRFKQDRLLTQQLQVSGFPSLVLCQENTCITLDIDYNNSINIINDIAEILKTNENYAAIRPITLPNA